eukprot:1150463-Pelagomonas_calceolata.AAC.1
MKCPKHRCTEHHCTKHCPFVCECIKQQKARKGRERVTKLYCLRGQSDALVRDHYWCTRVHHRKAPKLIIPSTEGPPPGASCTC